LTHVLCELELVFGKLQAEKMPTKSRDSFEANCKDVERLMEIHGELTGEGPGRKYGVEVLNKSAIVLMCAIWEAYCEDLATEAVEHLVTHAKEPAALPKGLRKQIAQELEADSNALAIWRVAGDGWRTLLKTRLADIAERRNRKLNTPKTINIEKLFEEAVGLPNIAAAWGWQNMLPEQAKDKLDGFIELRGAIAHRAKASTKVKKSDPRKFMEHTERLVEATDMHVSQQIRKACGKPLF
jgi:RiboL-PSP-HEPN